MKQLISAEALKFRTIRSSYAILCGALLLIVAATTGTAAASNFHAGDHPGRDTLSIAALALPFALVLGALAVTSEFRHGTITPALLVSPKRTPLLLAKALHLARIGLALGLLAFGGAATIALPILSARGFHTGLDTAHLIGIVIGGTIATSLFAVLGVGVGAVVRNQVGAIAASLCVLYGLEPLLTLIPGIGHAVQEFGLGGLASALSSTDSLHRDAQLLGQAPAALVLASYALAVLLIGVSLFRRRDVTP